jgi:hypothetical protein
MPKLCEGCGFYSAADAPTKCPTCDADLKFTFLAPAGKAAAPLKGAPTDPYGDLERQQAAARRGFLGLDWRVVNAVVAALVTVGIIGVRFYLRQERRAEREEAVASAQKIKVGMHISDAARLLDAASNTPNWRGSTRHDFDEDDDSDGSMEVNDGRTDLRITWRNGYVTAVEPTDGSGGGTRRRVTQPPPGQTTDDDGVVIDPAPAHPADRLTRPR